MNVVDSADGFLKNIEALRRENGGHVALDDVADVVQCLMTSFEGDITLADLKLHTELAELCEFIQSTRAEIAAIEPDRIRSEQIQPATDELDAVVNATAAATNTILDVAEALETMAGEDDERGDVFRGLATRIYEASNFQDITGQRITKVVALLRTVEDRLSSLAGVATATTGEAAPSASIDARTGDEGLMNGPSMPDEANNQDDIDALLASFD